MEVHNLKDRWTHRTSCFFLYFAQTTSCLSEQSVNDCVEPRMEYKNAGAELGGYQGGATAPQNFAWPPKNF